MRYPIQAGLQHRQPPQGLPEEALPGLSFPPFQDPRLEPDAFRGDRKNDYRRVSPIQPGFPQHKHPWRPGSVRRPHVLPARAQEFPADHNPFQPPNQMHDERAQSQSGPPAEALSVLFAAHAQGRFDEEAPDGGVGPGP